MVDLFNLLVNMEEPSELTPDDVKAVGDKYGINMHKEQLEGLQQLFGQYLEHAVPTGDQQLRWAGGADGRGCCVCCVLRVVCCMLRVACCCCCRATLAQLAHQHERFGLCNGSF